MAYDPCGTRKLLSHRAEMPGLMAPLSLLQDSGRFWRSLQRHNSSAEQQAFVGRCLWYLKQLQLSEAWHKCGSLANLCFKQTSRSAVPEHSRKAAEQRCKHKGGSMVVNQPCSCQYSAPFGGHGIPSTMPAVSRPATGTYLQCTRLRRCEDLLAPLDRALDFSSGLDSPRACTPPCAAPALIQQLLRRLSETSAVSAETEP